MKEPFEQRLFRIFAQAGYSPVQLLTVTPEEMVEIPGITVPNIRAVLCVQNKVLADRKTCGFMERGYLCFEEDCAAPVALRELMDRGLYQAPVNEYFAPGEYEAVINDSLQTFHPEYWQAREKMRAEKARTPHSKTAKHKERER